MHDPMGRVLGVDACKAGWVGIALDDVRAYVAASIGELVALAEADGPAEVVGIDIPIGLLRSSVFLVPVRAALEAPDHATASAINRERVGEGVSIQAYGLRSKLLQVDEWVRETGRRAVEVHPEVTFAQLAGAPLTVGKHTWAGAELRRGLLADAGIVLSGLGAAGQRAGVDDVLDAAAVAWSARRVALGTAIARPDPPEVFADGVACAVWT
ncbi:MAG TPA: DUF429 domain-containing protein [Amycolatopsis sp.]|nr:DUF429 domain-containing protein [Amycolatopsis sp.]